MVLARHERHGLCSLSGMIARRFEDLAVWQLPREGERLVFAFTADNPVRQDFDYCRQVRRSAAAAPRNIAEGFGRFMPGEFARSLRIAKGELCETLDHLDKALEQRYLSTAKTL